MDELFGLPAHPLVVHAPVVLLPLAVVGAAAMMIRPAWYVRFRWPVLAITAMGALGAVVAASTGEELEERVEDGASRSARRLIEDHAEAGEAARMFAIAFFVAVLVSVVVPWLLARRARAAAGSTAVEAASSVATPRWLRPVLMVFVAVTAIGSLITIVDAGHSGADSVWGDVPSGEDEDGEGGEGGADGDD
jgi:quinol-cytochrome oxidoreductase complex cytochrome b subunit